MADTIACAPLYERTLELVRNAPRDVSYRMMAECCNRTPQWVGQFAAGKIPDASIRAVQCLHDYLISL